MNDNLRDDISPRVGLIPTQETDLIGELLGLPVEKVHESLQHYTLRDLGTMTEKELTDTGLTPTRARRLHNSLELARRFAKAGPLPVGKQFLNPRQIFDAFHLRFRDEKREHFLVVLVDARHRILREEVISIGSLTSSIVHPREVFAPAVRASAGAVILIHNHPSGEPSPSEDDIAVTRRLERAAEILGIRILDHIIVGDGEYASFKEMGLM